MKISLVINADTRPGCDAECSKIGDFGQGSLQGCRSWDFLIDGVINKHRFLSGSDAEIETILYVDIHNPIPKRIQMKIEALQDCGYITKLITAQHSRARHRWNDWLYIDALCHATGEYVAHFDADAAAFSRSPMIPPYVELLKTFKYVCQPSATADHGMTHASTRFFICRRETLDLDELGRCLDDGYRQAKFPGQHLPALEHIIGALAGTGSVIYPPRKDHNYCVFSFVHYYRGLLWWLNDLPYEEVRRYVFERCGGICGPGDFIAQPL